MPLPSAAEIDARLATFADACRTHPVLAALCAHDRPIHLVGGSVRDLFLGASSHDHDFCTAGGAFDLARRVADATGGSFVPLKEGRGMARVVADGKWFDISDYQAADLEADLRARDLTINAMAVDLRALGQGRPPLVDPTGGREDLSRGLLRVPSADVLEADPLRLLRVVRFACVLGFEIEPATRAAMEGRGPSLARVAPDRCRQELLRILGTARAVEGVDMLAACGALAALLPELEPLRGLAQGGFHHLDVYAHTMLAFGAIDEAVARVRAMLDDPGPLDARLRRPIRGMGTSVVALLRFAALLHDVGKPAARHEKPDGRVSYEGHELTGAAMCDPIAERLRLSSAERSLVTGIVRWHLEPLQMKAPRNLRPRHIRRYFARTREAGVETLMMALADSAASRGPKNTPEVQEALHERISKMVNWYFSDAPGRCAPLIDGRAVAVLTGLPPGRAIGRLLDALADEQADGRVRTPAEAEAWVRAQAGRQTPS